MTDFRLDVSRDTGEATLWMAAEETACGYKPILAWPGMDGVRAKYAIHGVECKHHEMDHYN
ncbi:MAG: hypothetical protein SVO26_07360 [Chloroflexota bacterium]|nr:hypothetical protein [Chloroflexota bacterium]